MISLFAMKPAGTFLVLSLFHSSCEGLFLQPLTQGIRSMFGDPAPSVSSGPKYVIGTTNELKQVRARFPEYDPSRFIDINNAGRLPHPFALHSGFGQQTMKHLAGYAQPVQEPESPAPAYGKPTSSYGNPEPSYGMPVSSYPKPASNYGKPEVSSGYGKPEQPIDQGEPQPVPEAADLPTVNDESSSNWSSQSSSNEVNISQTAFSSSPDASITQTASISQDAGSSDNSQAPDASSNDDQQRGNGSNSVLQDVSVQQTVPSESNADFFPPQLPSAGAAPPLTSDNVIRPASRPPSTPNQDSASENAVDAGNSAENISSTPIDGNSDSVTQEASIQQTVNDGSDSGSSAAPTSPDFVSDNVIRPASRPVSSPDSVATPENTEAEGNTDDTAPAPTGSNAEITQSASSDSGSVVQDASIEQNVDGGASTPVAGGDSEKPAVDTDTSSSSNQQQASDASGSGNDSQSSGSDADVFEVNHSKNENSFNETKTFHNTTKETSTTVVTTHIAGVDPATFGQIPAANPRHPFLNQAHKIISSKLPKPGFVRLIRRSGDENEGELADAPQNPVDVEEVPAEEVPAEDETELDLRQLADNYPVLEKQEDIEDYFTYISNIDTDHCLAKTICELASNPTKKGNEGLQIDEFFEKYDASNSKEGMKMYKDAHLAGKGGEETCLARFPDCKLDDQEPN